MCAICFQILHRLPRAVFFFFNDTATTEIYTLSLHDALPISSLDAFGHELGRRDLALLEVPIGGAFFHGAETAHPADHFEAPALEQERLTRALLRAGEHRAHHYALGARGERLDHVARVLDAAIRDHRHVARSRHGVDDRRDLRDADAGDDAGGADRARTHAQDRKSVV